MLALVFAGAGQAARYLVVYKQQDVPGNAARVIARSGGTLLARYDAIGVAVADTDDPSFSARLAADPRVFAAVATDLGGGDAIDFAEASGPPPGDLPNTPAADGDTFSSLQWNMRQIFAPEAHAITGGSGQVRVGVIDTGIDSLHPDLVQNVDFANSASCIGGVPNTAPAAWQDDHGHGTHNAGTIAAASNGIGIVGVAPNVRIAAIKAGDAANRYAPEAVVCALMWAAGRGLDVANESFAVDKPAVTDMLDLWCHSDPLDRPVIKAVQRATRYAYNRGVTMVASAGNSNLDLADPPPGNDCVRLPTELPGVVTVTATGPSEQKASYSNYGVGVADVAAPGGDGPPPAGPVLSTWPASKWGATVICDPLGSTVFPPFPPLPPCPMPADAPGTAYYRYMAGTSAAAAHVSGVAALVISWYGDSSSPQNGKLRPGFVQSILEQTADPLPCPPDGTACQGGDGGYNSFFGHGRVNALRALQHVSGG
jgi:subtilisin family serine protease